MVTPQKIGAVYVYDQPNIGHQDYDVPPSRYFAADGSNSPGRGVSPQPTYSSPIPFQHRQPYQTPISRDVPLSKEDLHKGGGKGSGKLPQQHSVEELYDIPPAQQSGNIPALATYDVLPPSRVSNVSMMSTGSTMSGSMSSQSLPVGSAPASSCGSARSSFEIHPQDLYDVPPKPKALGAFPLQDRKSAEMMELYDTPPKSTEKLTRPEISVKDMYDTPPKGVNPKEAAQELYDTPKRDSRNARASSGDSGIMSEKHLSIYDMPDEEQQASELYDVPSNNAPTSQHSKAGGNGNQGIVRGLQATRTSGSGGSVYDIPPQVTRDSAISLRSDAGSSADDVINRLSTCSMDSKSSDMSTVPYDELLLDLDSAMELLVKLQQDVQSTSTKLLSFVSSTWRQKENLEPKLYEVKQACYNVKNSVKEFVDFSQGTLANSAKAEDKKLSKKLAKQLEPLQDTYISICKSIKHLDDFNWHITRLTSTAHDPTQDDLGDIVTLVKDVPYVVRTLASFIQGNSVLLFQRSHQLETVTIPSDNSLVHNTDGSQMPVYAQPNKPKPPPVKPKPKVAQGQKEGPPVLTRGSNRSSPEKSNQDQNGVCRTSSIQDRPLPPPPPGGDTENTLSTSSSSSTRPLSADSLHKAGEQPVIYDVPKSQQPDSDVYANDSREWLEDYDYVALDTKQKSQQCSSAWPVASRASTGGAISPHGDVRKSSQEAHHQMQSNVLCTQQQIKTIAQGNATEPAAVPGSDLQVVTGGNQGQAPSHSGAAGSPTSPSAVPPGSLTGEGDGGLSTKFKERLEKLQQKGIASTPQKNGDKINTDSSNYIAPSKLPRIRLEENDKQILAFYAPQVENHSGVLVNAIDAFFQSIEYNQPPKIFIAHSKFVVLAAHKMVYIADTLHRNITNEEVRNKIMACANYLCDNLKTTVTSTKNAALQYPSVQAVQDMVDKVVDVSHTANELKLVILQASAL